MSYDDKIKYSNLRFTVKNGSCPYAQYQPGFDMTICTKEKGCVLQEFGYGNLNARIDENLCNLDIMRINDTISDEVLSKIIKNHKNLEKVVAS